MNNFNQNFNNNYSTRKSSYWECELSPFHTKKITAKHPVKEDIYKEGVLLYSKGETPEGLYMFDYGTFLAHLPNLEKWNTIPFIQTSQVFSEVQILEQKRKVEYLNCISASHQKR